ncbi:hypothetical protein [Halopelagius fulvigenes]|uniref:Uncharacterized protein n=1 Tax=Halopelagius fulvigenes TaxID=1198324 RepID=A0ABD5U1U1_9EURY
MSNDLSLGSHLKRDLTSNLSVNIVSVVLGTFAFFALQVVESVTGGLFLALNIAVFVPYAYERYWPVDYATGAAIVWTISAALVTGGLYVGFYRASLGAFSAEYAAGAAFVVTAAVQYAIAALFARVRRNA